MNLETEVNEEDEPPPPMKQDYFNDYKENKYKDCLE